MDLDEIVGSNNIEQDTWSSNQYRFGQENQLQVIGYLGKQWTNRVYLLSCAKCKEDAELFGEGYFKSTKSNLLSGKLPCGCSSIPKWSISQFRVLCERSALALGHSFEGFIGEFCGQNTRVRVLCGIHGAWTSGTINTLINTKHGCPMCGSEATRQQNIKPDSEMIASFLASGAFHPDTKFWRSERKTKKGNFEFWHVYCPECGTTGETTSSGLRRGSACCGCSPHRQKEAYINRIISDNFSVVALKFGITTNSKRRIKQLSTDNIYKVQQFLIYKFPDVASCKKAERECKRELECGILTKEEMPQGFTETTDIKNLLKIIEIYTANGGVRIHGKDMES